MGWLQETKWHWWSICWGSKMVHMDGTSFVAGDVMQFLWTPSEPSGHLTSPRHWSDSKVFVCTSLECGKANPQADASCICIVICRSLVVFRVSDWMLIITDHKYCLLDDVVAAGSVHCTLCCWRLPASKVYHQLQRKRWQWICQVRFPVL